MTEKKRELISLGTRVDLGGGIVSSSMGEGRGAGRDTRGRNLLRLRKRTAEPLFQKNREKVGDNEEELKIVVPRKKASSLTKGGNFHKGGLRLRTKRKGTTGAAGEEKVHVPKAKRGGGKRVKRERGT